MKTLLALLLIIPSLSWASEQKARELYVKAKSDLMNKGCEFEMLASKFGSMVYGTNDVEKSELPPLINELKKCGYYYKENTLPIFDEIINEYPETEVAYNLMSGEEYISEGLLMGLMSFIEVGSAELEKELKQETIKSNEEPITIAEIDKLRRQLHSCLNLSVPVTDLRNLKPIINIKVNPDRTVKSAKLINKDKSSNQNFRVAADASLRAIYSPECSPLELPEGKYSQWKEINFTFDFSWMYD